MNKNPKNQFQPGNQASKGKGRKGYEFEEKQRKKMTALLNRALNLALKIAKGKATEAEVKRFVVLNKMTLKIMDKFHANKSDIKVESHTPILIK